MYLDIRDLFAEIQYVSRASNIDRHRQFQLLVKSHRGCNVEDDRNFADNCSTILRRHSEIRLTAISCDRDDLMTEFWLFVLKFHKKLYANQNHFMISCISKSKYYLMIIVSLMLLVRN